ncbi:MAG: hypothetical protein QUU85_05205, partial [Candidatus Eisenbacteria bacterium]|nr:hypothetical protein [Candidatus Eisenbacteria bacterium]
MHRIDRSLPVLFGILTGLAGLCSPMFAPPASASAWLENPNVLVEVGGKPSGTTHVYDSEDFQQMLLVGDGQPTALVIDLTTSSVSEIPAARVQETADGANTPDDFAGELLVTDVEQQDGTILLSWGDAPVAIRPLPPLIGPTTLERILAVKPAYGASAAAYKPDPAKVAALK